MFGIFSKSGFESEMETLDKKHKRIGEEVVAAMKNIQIQRQMELLLAMIEVVNKKLCFARNTANLTK